MAEKGLSFLLKVGAPAGTTVAGLRATAMTLNGEAVDVTNKDSTNQWRELLAGAGVISMSITGSGVFVDDSNVLTLRANSIARTLDAYTLAFESGDTYDGTFQVTNVEHAGDYNGEVTYNVSLESSGEISLTSA